MSRIYTYIYFPSESCLPGYWSQTGVTPCSPCPQGSHAEDYGSSVCVACPSSQTTLMRGSSNASDCTRNALIFTGVNTLHEYRWKFICEFLLIIRRINTWHKLFWLNFTIQKFIHLCISRLRYILEL